jgi:hypothetical protein
MTITTGQVQAMFITARRLHSANSARSQQQRERRIGPSELGFCRSYLYWMMTNAPQDNEGGEPDDKLAAFVGSAYGDRIEEAMRDEYGVLTQSEFTTTFPSGRQVTCHTDMVDVENNCVYDGKTKDGLDLIRAADEPERQHRYQIATYCWGLIQAGILKPGAQAFLVYADRAGNDPQDVVHEVVVDQALMEEIDAFVEDPLYAIANLLGPDAVPKDKPREFCERYCTFFETCRGGETRAEGLIENEEVSLAVKVYNEGRNLATTGDKMKKTASAVLKTVAGRVMTEDGIYEISQTEIQGTQIPASYRRGYSRLNVKAVK